MPNTSGDKGARAAPFPPDPLPEFHDCGQIVELGPGMPRARLLHFPQDFPGPRPTSRDMAHDLFTPARPLLTPELMLRAYAAGIFPMSDGADYDGIFWVDPQRRGVFPLDGFHVSRSLRRRIRKADYDIYVNRDFAGTVAACADRHETWINSEIYTTYLALHAEGYAHSVEVWMEDELVGGVFGVALGAAFFGESMFSRRTDGSKLALAHLIARLRSGGFQLFDTQFTTEHLISLGAVEMPRAEYRRQLHLAVTSPADFFAEEKRQAPHDPLEQIRQAV